MIFSEKKLHIVIMNCNITAMWIVMLVRLAWISKKIC